MGGLTPYPVMSAMQPFPEDFSRDRACHNRRVA